MYIEVGSPFSNERWPGSGALISFGDVARPPELLLDFAAEAPSSLSPLVTYARAGSGAGYINSAGTYIPTAANVARLDATKGLLIEESRTNSIRNNTMAGAGAGTRPTLWPAASAGAGLTLTIVGTVVQSGMTSIRYRLAGTSTGATSTFIFFETTSGIPAVQGNIRSLAACVRMEAGSMTGLTAIRLNITERNGGGGALASTAGTPFTPTSAALGLQRFSLTAAMANAGTAADQPSLLLQASNGGVVDITIDIGLPQDELGTGATSPIQTSSATVTRAADVATQASLSSTYGGTVGFVRIVGITGDGAAGTQTLWEQDDGTANNRLRIYRSSDTVLHASATVGGVVAASLDLDRLANNTAFTVTFSWGGGTYAATLNSNVVLTAQGTAVPQLNTIRLGADTVGNYWNGWITSEYLVASYRAPSTPTWPDVGALMSMDFANQRYYNATPGFLTVVRNSTETAYDASGAQVSFAAQTPVLPSYNPNDSNAALGLSIYLGGSQWWANSAVPATQTKTPTVAGTYNVYCFGSGHIDLTGGVTRTINGTSAALGFYGAVPDTFTLDGLTSVTATVVGTVTFMQLENNFYPAPPIITTATSPLTRNNDDITLDLTAHPGLLSASSGTLVVRFFASQISQAATMISLTDGTSNNRLAMNYKVTPTFQSGLTVVVGGVVTGAADPALPFEVDIGYHTFAGSWSIQPDGSGFIKVSLDGSPVVEADFPAGDLPTILNEMAIGIDRISGIFAQPLSGAIQRITTFPLLSDSEIIALTSVTGP